ncbi:MAG: lasso peptide biosynthesis B2 protein [Reyranella sp.]|uniref:lasso peptide biosynthesis B2 protein n=1 Tax=Reyranella sp. TaxID=1929291 RepID=UPI003D1034E5
MTPLTTFLALPGGDRRLLLDALLTLVGVRLALRVVRADRLRRPLGRARPHARPAERIAWAVQAASRRLPGTTCLAAALAAQRLLAREGHDCQLTIGVARSQRGLAAHAWVVRNGVTLVGGEASAGYKPLVAWSGEPSARPDSAACDRS